MKMSELETEHLRLREFRQTDLPDVARWDEGFRAEEFLEFCFRSYREWGMGPWAMALKTKSLEETRIEEPGFEQPGFEQPGFEQPGFEQPGFEQPGLIVGNCGFCRIRYDRGEGTFEHCGEVNYFVARQYRGKGLATEALRAVVKFGFADLRLTRIRGRCAPENVSSERVLLKAGLKFERMLDATADGLPEQKLYAIMREDFQVLRSPSPSRHRSN